VTTGILLADDHGLVRSGIRALVEQIPGVTVVGEAGDGPEALRLVAELRPELALVNISMPGLNGIELARRISEQHPRTRVIMLSLHAEPEYVRRAFAVGAAGYVVKTAARDELDLAIRAVARGGVWLDPSISKAVVDALVRGEGPPQPFELLTPRQREVLQLVAEGHSSKQIADSLGLSVKTVETHRALLMRRLGVDSVAGLVRAAIRLGISDPRST
jgi:DNA-binding NarL/FixJ family response regulator